MKDATKVWDKPLEEALDKMVDAFRRSVISDCESFATFRGQEKVTAQGLELALYKSIMTINKTNKAVMFKRLGPAAASDLIQTLEDRAFNDVSMSILEDLEANFDKLPPEIQEVVKIMRIKFGGKTDKGF